MCVRWRHHHQHSAAIWSGGRERAHMSFMRHFARRTFDCFVCVFLLLPPSVCFFSRQCLCPVFGRANAIMVPFCASALTVGWRQLANRPTPVANPSSVCSVVCVCVCMCLAFLAPICLHYAQALVSHARRTACGVTSTRRHTRSANRAHRDLFGSVYARVRV